MMEFRNDGKGLKMKKMILVTLVLIAALFPSMTFAKDKDEKKVVLPKNAEGLVQYQEAIEIPGATAAVLFSRAKNFGAMTFKSAIHTLQNEDPAAGRLVYKGTFSAPYVMGTIKDVRFTMTIEVKVGKARITLSNMGVLYGEVNQNSQPIEELLKEDGSGRAGLKTLVASIDIEAREIVGEFKQAMVKQEENW